jgi:hypothetical protein
MPEPSACSRKLSQQVQQPAFYTAKRLRQRRVICVMLATAKPFDSPQLYAKTDWRRRVIRSLRKTAIR